MTVRLVRIAAASLIVAIGGCAEAPTERATESNAARSASETTAMPAPETDGAVGASSVLNAVAPTLPSASAPPTAPVTLPGAPETNNVTLAVEGEGLRLFDRTTSSASQIAFGRPAAGVLAALERLRGPAGRGTNQDCGAGPVEYANWPDGLSLVFQRDRFVGWGLDRRAAGGIGTGSSIGPGSTRAQLDDAYGDVRFTRSSIGQEFSVAGFSGVLDGTGALAEITDMWAGVSCVAR